MSLSRKHHFIARSILSRFQSSAGKFWVYDHKRRSEYGVEHRNPDNCFWKAHDNTMLNRDAKPIDVSLEHDYSILDEDWAKLTDIFIRNDKILRFNFSNNGDNIREKIFLQMSRSPDLIYNLEQTFNQLADNISNDLDFETRKHFLSENTQKPLRQNAIVTARRREMSSYTRYLISLLFPTILKIPKISRKNFIIGSCGMADGVLPISPKHAICLSSEKDDLGKVITMSGSKEKQIDAINESIAKNSEFGFAGGYKNTIKKLHEKFYPQK